MPRLLFSPDDVLETKTTDLGDRRITMQKVVPVELPPPPEPATPPDPKDPATMARMQAARENFQASRFVLIGATTYMSVTFPDGPRTRVTLRDSYNGAMITCWSSADWRLLGGTGGFVSDDGLKHALIMMLSSMDIDRTAAFVASRGGNYQPPVIPVIPAGAASFVITEGEPSAATLETLAELHEFYNDQVEDLTARHVAREAEHAARKAELIANPPPPKDIVIRHWRMDEAGQQGVTPKPAVAR